MGVDLDASNGEGVTPLLAAALAGGKGAFDGVTDGGWNAKQGCLCARRFLRVKMCRVGFKPFVVTIFS